MNVSPPSRPAATQAWAASATRLFDAEQLLARPDDRRPPRRYTHQADRGPHSPRHAATKPFTARRCAAQTSARSHANRATHNGAATAYRSPEHKPSGARHAAAQPEPTLAQLSNARGVKASALRPAGSPVARPAILEPGGRHASPAPPANSSSRSQGLQPLAGPRCDGRQQPARTSKRKPPPSLTVFCAVAASGWLRGLAHDETVCGTDVL